MKRWRPLALIVSAGIVVAVLLGLTTTDALVAKPKAGKVATEKQAFTGWELTGGTVVSPGTTGTIPEGTLSTGYVVEAKAKAKGAGLPSGTFKVSLSAFSPNEDMPGQLAGMWYVKGDWEIVANGAPAAEAAVRHNKHTMAGTLLAELPFDPITTPGMMAAAISLPMSPDGGRWSRGDLVYSGNQLFEGTMMGSLEQWPEATTPGADGGVE